MRAIFSIVAAVMLISCNLDKEATPTLTPSTENENFDNIYSQGWELRDDQTARITVSFESQETLSTRSIGTAMERNINDINLYFFSDVIDNPQRIYLTSNESVTLPITPGNWSLYAIANIGENLGERTKAEIINYDYQITKESDLYYNNAIAMSYNAELSIADKDRETIQIELSRVVARIDTRVTVDSSATNGLTINRIRLVNVPKCRELFADTNNYSQSDLITYDYQTCSSGSTHSIYMLENLAGTNSSITDQSKKIEANAPATASYIEIEGEDYDSWITYRIYLGGNATTDFNVERNNIYNLDITIFGSNSNDLRVETEYFPMDVRVWISSCDIQMNQQKTPSSIAWIASIDIDITVSVDQPLLFDIDVEYRPMTNITTSGEMSHIDCTFTNEPIVTIKAGSLKGSMQTNYVAEVWYYALMTHARLFGVVKSSSEDNNTYIINEDYFEPTVTYELTVI